MRVRSRIVRLLGLLAVLWLAGVPASLYAQAATPTPVPALAGRRVVKEVCRSLEGYTLEALKRELELAAKREAANELFGELIVASTTVQNWTVTEDQLRSQSLGLVRVEGSPEFRSEVNTGEECIILTVYATERDLARFEPQALSGRACVSGADLTLRQAQALADEKARLQALLAYDPRLAQYEPAAVLPLLRQIIPLESNVPANTDNYCVAVQGNVIPIEVDGLLFGDDAFMRQDAPATALSSSTFLPTTETPRPTATPTLCARGVVRVNEICATVTPMPEPTRTPARPTATRVPPTATPFPTAIPTLQVQTEPIPVGSSESIWARTSFQELSAPGTQSYAVDVRTGERLRWAFEWCALSQSQLQQILAPFALELSIDNVSVPLNDITVDTKTSGSWRCRYWATMISDWPAGQVVALEISYVLSEQIYDGQNYYSPGRYRQIIYATVQ